MEAEISYKGGVWKYCLGTQGWLLGKAKAEPQVRSATDIEQNKETTTLLGKRGTRKTCNCGWIGLVIQWQQIQIHVEVPGASSASAWKWTYKVFQASISGGNFWKGNTSSEGGLSQSLQERNLDPLMGHDGFHPSMLRVVFVQIQKDSWRVDCN